MRDDEGGIDLAALNPLEEQQHLFVRVGLTMDKASGFGLWA